MTVAPAIGTPPGSAVALADGRRATIRQMTPDDADALVDAVEHEDYGDLRRRFMGPPPPAHVLVGRLRRTDGIHDFALGAFADDGRLVGVAQFDRLDDGPVAELAIEVAHDWQRTGLGTALLRDLGEAAKERGVHELTATFFADNVAIRRLLHRLDGTVLTGFDHGEGFARARLAETRE